MVKSRKKIKRKDAQQPTISQPHKKAAAFLQRLCSIQKVQ
ncbi:hypothetical protein TGS27_2292 [Geobacillus stearothermophilus]|uniref:Uncharacterized protein n=1 Tax=Geobacillus stearothermophilus TaxID=1422 RepID=A0A150MAV7_GEOSE|nr:hypothetical protein GS8_289 [Geobacillus stearothermophilus]KYD21362.1 hypothetical protein B4109_0908 [Geobacillus stearothermophilus]KYD33497.1 hypothetical protein B4114_1107 [Geobacillus stearothermophilus]OAO78949.1 hypothetical protein TGS27_2292 [Geobacillus stearothermophilus]